jgi:hypothetical protein
MRVIFAGPTLHDASLTPTTAYDLRPPARQGDFYRAVSEGVTVIGLVDGIYEHVPAIWHKEILFGLANGVHIFGAASMGALRAAECAAYGMIGIGKIFEGYASGELEDDADVAQAHGPAELGFVPLNEPLVNVRATLERCHQISEITNAECDLLLAAAKDIFFKERTYKRIVQQAIPDKKRATALLAILRAHTINQKLEDSHLLIDTVIATPAKRFEPTFDWEFQATGFWSKAFPPG